MLHRSRFSADLAKANAQVFGLALIRVAMVFTMKFIARRPFDRDA